MRTRFFGSVIVALLGATWIPGIAQNTPNPDRVSTIRARLAQIGDRYSQLPPNHRVLADGAKRMAQLALVYDKLAASASKPGAQKAFAQAMAKADGDAGSGAVTVNDNSTDLDFSSYDGVTQSETHTAMCGNQVVVGFNDSGSEFQTAFFGTGGLSFSGSAVSSDGGRTFHDIGVTNPGPDFNNFLSGDPLITCTDSSTFFYVQLFETATDSAVAISKSTDGGNTWGDPQEAVGKPAFVVVPPFAFAAHFLDKPWTVIDPRNPQRMFITYTDFDDTNTSPAVGPGVCGLDPRTAIEMVVSNDGGKTFSAPIVIDQVCGSDVAVTASHVAVNSRGIAYVAWERFNPTTVEVRITQVGPNGIPGPAIVVDQKVMGGDTFLLNRGVFFGVQETETDLQGEFRDIVGIDLAVDHSGGPNDGTVYVTWDDGRNKSVPDLAGFTIEGFPPDQPGVLLPFSQLILTVGNYAYTDILLSKSNDGVHFGPTTQVNSDHQPKFGGGHDHFQPAIATDATGQVAICWYDRRNDPKNFAVERYCAQSHNGAKAWNDFRVPIPAFAPIHRLDFLVNPAYMGDYDGLTSDSTGKTAGFIGAFEWMSSGMNPDVKAFRF